MGSRTHDHFCHKCRVHWSPFDFKVCPDCDTGRFSEYDLNLELGDESSVEQLRAERDSWRWQFEEKLLLAFRQRKRAEKAEANLTSLCEALENEWHRNHGETCDNTEQECKTFGGPFRCSYPKPEALARIQATEGEE